MFCHKCGTSIDKTIHFCSQCGAKIESDKLMINKQKKIWLLPATTLFIVIIVFIGFYLYETSINSTVDTLVKEGETKALEGDFVSAKANFEEALQKRPHHRVATLDLEVVERGLYYEKLLDKAASLEEKQQFQDGLRVLDELEPVFAKEQGPFISRLKERYRLQAASLTVAGVEKVKPEQMIDELANIFEKINDIKTEEAMELSQYLKEKIIDLAIKHGHDYLDKNQFTEAELEFDRGLSIDPKNKKLLAYKETAKKERFAFEQAEQERLEKARLEAAEEAQFNQTQAIKLLAHEFSFEKDELRVWGEVKNVGTQPISEIEIDYIIFGEEGNQIVIKKVYISPNLLMPNEQGFFEDFQLISQDVGHIEIADYNWKVH